MRSLLPILLLSVLSAQEIPRPEFPQPQFQREQWLTLNGRWEFEFDDGNAGLDQNWPSQNKKFGRTILVPFCFESARSGIGDTSFHPWVWYRRGFQTPAGWEGKRVLLHFGAVDYRAMVWLNGQYLGGHEGGHVPFWFDVTPQLRPGTNVLTVRAEDPPEDRSIPRGKQYWAPKSRGIFYTRTTGIWQPVWLEATGDSYLRKLRSTTSNDGSARFEAMIARPQAGLELHATVRFGKETVASASGRVSGSRSEVIAGVMDPRLWSANSPNLYDVTLELRRGGAVIDRVQSYFGFRSVGADRGRVLVNGRPVFLKMVLDQGYWPESILTPPSDEAIQYDIRMTKEMGFNGARKHQKLEDPRFLYWADKMGLYVSSEMANAYVFDDDYAGRFTREWIEAVERDYNHPSIVMWVPVNESWGVPDLRESRQQNHLKSLVTLTKTLDATRLVIDNDGWEHLDTTDLFAVHDYARTGELLYEHYKEMEKSGIPVRREAGRDLLVTGYSYNHTPILLSEFGGIAYIMPGAQVPADAWGYSGVEKTTEAALDRLRGLYLAIRKIPGFVGLCYTQLTDVEQEINGLLTFDRKPKFDPKILREINGLVP